MRLWGFGNLEKDLGEVLINVYYRNVCMGGCIHGYKIADQVIYQTWLPLSVECQHL